ncbi:hypothetical protein [Aliikangiella maris]|uniref:Delta-60 repeat domain-containing protein n=2 Tax=Aliikangiella maris TaxID=3162458 RepID=A0ABV2BU71_9GAMM
MFSTDYSNKWMRIDTNGELEANYELKSTNGIIEFIEAPQNKLLAITRGGTNSLVSIAQYNIEDGKLDAGFGNNGLIVVSKDKYLDDSSYIANINILADGNILLTGSIYSKEVQEGKLGTGDLLAVKLSLNGSLIYGFGEQGYIRYSDNNSPDKIIDMFQLKNGQLLILGISYDELIVTKFDEKGNKVNSYGDNGIFRYQISAGKYIKSVYGEIQTDEKLLVGFERGYDKGILRLNTDGNLDYSFAELGVKLFTGLEDNFIYFDFSLQSNNKAILLGVMNRFPYNFAVDRLTLDGHKDPSFQRVEFGEYFELDRSKILIGNNNEVFIYGGVVTLEEAVIKVTKILPDGNLDQSFASNGLAEIESQNDWLYLSSMYQQADNKLVLIGFRENQLEESRRNRDIFVSRLNLDGSLDESFANAGMLFIGENDKNELAKSIIQIEDSFWLLGKRIDGQRSKVSITQLDLNGNIVSGFAINGVYTLPDEADLDFARRSLAMTYDESEPAFYIPLNRNMDITVAKLISFQSKLNSDKEESKSGGGAFIFLLGFMLMLNLVSLKHQS